MNKYKKGILFIFVLFFFVFSTQQASAFNPKSLFKLFTKIIDDIPTSQSVRSVSENMGWLTWFDLFKITMKGMI